MALLLRSTLAALLAAMLPPATLANGPPAPRVAAVLDPAARDAAAIVDRFHHALRSGRLGAAGGFLDDDALIFESGGVERSKAEYASHHLPADAAFSKAVASVITARRGASGNGFAWVATESRMTGSFKGKAIDRLSTETMILRQSAGAWKIIHIHWSSAPAR